MQRRVAREVDGLRGRLDRCPARRPGNACPRVPRCVPPVVVRVGAAVDQQQRQLLVALREGQHERRAAVRRRVVDVRAAVEQHPHRFAVAGEHGVQQGSEAPRRPRRIGFAVARELRRVGRLALAQQDRPAPRPPPARHVGRGRRADVDERRALVDQRPRHAGMRFGRGPHQRGMAAGRGGVHIRPGRGQPPHDGDAAGLRGEHQGGYRPWDGRRPDRRPRRGAARPSAGCRWRPPASAASRPDRSLRRRRRRPRSVPTRGPARSSAPPTPPPWRRRPAAHSRRGRPPAGCGRSRSPAAAPRRPACGRDPRMVRMTRRIAPRRRPSRGPRRRTPRRGRARPRIGHLTRTSARGGRSWGILAQIGRKPLPSRGLSRGGRRSVHAGNRRGGPCARSRCAVVGTAGVPCYRSDQTRCRP